MKCKTISIANQKGGVGKTTMTANLSAGLVKHGKRVLAIDFDSQGNLSSYLGYERDNLPTINDLLLTVVKGAYLHYDPNTTDYSEEECATMLHLHEAFHRAVRHNKTDGIDYIPADISLAGADLYLSSAICRERILDIVLSYFKAEYDYILIDCPPSLGMFLANALTTADELLIPVQPENWAVDGLTHIIDTYKQIKRNINPKLTLNGFVINMADNTLVYREVRAVLHDQFGSLLYSSEIRRSVKATRSTIEQKSLVHDNKNTLGQQYMTLVKEFLEKE